MAQGAFPTEAVRAAMTIFVCIGLMPAAMAQPRGGRFTGNSFERLDRNGDGQITRDEFPRQIERLFDDIDADGDGAITAAEDAAFRHTGDGPRLPDSIRAELDVPYTGGDNPHQRLDLLLPRKPASDAPLPVIVFVHGGAWRGGDRREGLGMLVRVASGGRYAGAAIGYRFSGEATWPAQIHDCKAAIRWLRAHAEEYHLDPDRIGVIGPSAGGHLAAMLGVSGDVERLEGSLGEHLDVSSRVACVVDEYGPTELLAMSEFASDVEHDAPDSPESKLLGGPIQEHKDAARGASPITYVSADDPPFLLVHGTDDPLVPYDQSERFYDALEQEGVEALFITVEGGGHGGFRSAELDRRIGLFFDKYLRHVDVEVPSDPIVPGQKRADAHRR